MPRTRTTLAARTGALLTVLAALLSGSLPAPAAGVVDRAPGAASSDGVRNAVFVGNNWDGTADVHRRPDSLRAGSAAINIIPDKDERMAEIAANPVRLAYFLAIRRGDRRGPRPVRRRHVLLRPTARLLIVSRPAFADVVAIGLATGKIVWRFPVAGHRARTTWRSRPTAPARRGLRLDRERRARPRRPRRQGAGPLPVRRLARTRTSSSTAGERILHASIGIVYTPGRRSPALDSTKGDRVLQIVDARHLRGAAPIDLRASPRRAAAWTDMSTAVRPMTLSPDERPVLLPGLVLPRLPRDGPGAPAGSPRVERLPNLVKDMPREQYLLDSAHHGIAMNPAGTKLCVAGTMDDYATVVDARTFQRGRLLKGGRQALLGDAELGRPVLLHLLERHRRDRRRSPTGPGGSCDERRGRRPPAADPQRRSSSALARWAAAARATSRRTSRCRRPAGVSAAQRRSDDAGRARPSTSARGPAKLNRTKRLPVDGVEVDARREGDAGAGQQVVGEGHRVVGQVPDVGVHVERAVGRRELGDPEPAGARRAAAARLSA